MEEDCATYLGAKGYTIYKESLTVHEQELIRRELTVKPFAPKSSIAKPQAFPVYRESKKKFYLPRFYGINTYGIPDEERISSGKDIDLKFKGELRDFQKPIVDTYIKSALNNECGLLHVATGMGKCHAKGTPIMLSNGEIKKVENIKVGDKLMGDDSTPRTVLSLARGREMMYDIIPTKGDKYTVNESHILSLRCIYTPDRTIRKDPEKEENRKNQNYIKGKIIDIEVKDFLKLPKNKNMFIKSFSHTKKPNNIIQTIKNNNIQ